MTRNIVLAAALCLGCAQLHTPVEPPGTRDGDVMDASRDAGVPGGYRCIPSPEHSEEHCHFYNRIGSARESGVALYLPFSDRNLREGAILDEGGYFPGLSYPFEGDSETLEQETDERWGPRVDLSRGPLEMRFPLTPGAQFTMLVVLDSATGPMGAQFTWSTGSSAGCAGVVSIERGRQCVSGDWCMRSSPGCEAEPVETPLRVEPTASGVVSLFLSWQDDQLEARSGRHQVSVPWADGVRTPAAAPTQLGPAHLLSLVVWDRVLSPATMDVIAEVDSEISDGF